MKDRGSGLKAWAAARQPRRENVAFHATPAEAEAAYFRRCAIIQAMISALW